MTDSEHHPTVIDPPELGPARGYANGMLGPADGRVLCVAGQIGWDGEQRIIAGGLVPQFDRALANVLTVVEHAGGQPQSVVRLTIFVVDLDDYRRSRKAIGEVYRARFGRHFPAMSLVQITGLLEPGAVVEIEATAVISTPASPP